MNPNVIYDRHYIKKRKAEREKENSNERRKRRMNAKLRFLRVVCAVLLFALIGRVSYIAVIRGEEYERKALENIERRTQARTVNPNRGAIIDRNKQNLAVSNIVYRVILDVRLLSRADERDKEKMAQGGDSRPLTSDKVFEALSGVTGITVPSLNKYLEKNLDGSLKFDTHYQVLGVVTHAEAEEIRKHPDIFYVHLEEMTERNYIYGTFAPQVIGFMRGGAVWGLENRYNAELKGVEGLHYSGGFSGQNALLNIEAQAGCTIVTTLDFTIQQFAQNAADKMYSQYSPQTASVIVMNPMTGEILAMAESPVFDLNAPADVTLTNNERLKLEWDELTDEQRLEEFQKIWRNFNVTSTFEPGSIFKPIVVAAALEEGVITPTIPVSYFCGGGKMVQGWETPIPCHLSYGHGQQTLEEVISNSCNVAMMDIGEALGRELFYKYQREFGFGEKTGIDLPSEISASSQLHSLATLSPLDLATGSFGQGFACTSIQAMTAFAALINGGNLMRPYIVSQVIDRNGNVVYENRPVITRKVISKETSDYLREAMVSVVSDGTGRRAAIEGYNIGGKTGTGQQTITRDEYTISFIAYLTAENPEILAIALIDRPAEYIEGSTSAAPILREVLENIIEYRAILPSDPDSVPLVVRTSEQSQKINNYVGMNVRDAIASLNMAGINYRLMDLEGSVVTRQFPAEGSDVDTDSVVLLNIAVQDEVALVSVPDVVGMTVSQARYIIENCGFVAVTDNTAPYIIPEDESPIEEEEPAREPVVASQSPHTGVALPKGTQIVIKTE